MLKYLLALLEPLGLGITLVYLITVRVLRRQGVRGNLVNV